MSVYGPKPKYEKSSSTVDLAQLTSNLDMGGYKIINLANPRERTDASTSRVCR